jgi:hypothetical protein
MKRLSFMTMLILTCLVCAERINAEAEVSASHKAFFEGIKKFCGQSFEGVTQFPKNSDDPFAGKKLVITIADCDQKEIRIPFQVGEDKSRTWILKMDETGLLLKHDHRHADGTPDKITMYGGWATPDGTAHKQQFPADAETKNLIPEAATNVWAIEIDNNKQELVYSLERHNKPRYRAVFTLSSNQ